MDQSTLIAAFAAAFGSMMLGALWYSPVMFGTPWKRLVQNPEAKEPNAAIAYGGAFGLMLLGAVVFGAFIGVDPDLGFALGAGASAGLAWAAGSLWISYLFEARPLKLGLINGGFLIVQYTLFGLVFGLL